MKGTIHVGRCCCEKGVDPIEFCKCNGVPDPLYIVRRSDEPVPANDTVYENTAYERWTMTKNGATWESDHLTFTEDIVCVESGNDHRLTYRGFGYEFTSGPSNPCRICRHYDRAIGIFDETDELFLAGSLCGDRFPLQSYGYVNGAPVNDLYPFGRIVACGCEEVGPWAKMTIESGGVTRSDDCMPSMQGNRYGVSWVIKDPQANVLFPDLEKNIVNPFGSLTVQTATMTVDDNGIVRLEVRVILNGGYRQRYIGTALSGTFDPCASGLQTHTFTDLPNIGTFGGIGPATMTFTVTFERDICPAL